MITSQIPPPSSVDDLCRRAAALTGLSIGELYARYSDTQAPQRLLRHKGQVGELIERALGAAAGNQDLPDFPELGVELKTIPVDPLGHVRESTYVCYLDPRRVLVEEWRTSRVFRKLRCLLWIPVEWASHRPLAEHAIGRPLLWKPSRAERALLRSDWLELVGMVATGHVDELTAHIGHALQVRPKARDSRARTHVDCDDGRMLATIPRGFYLRARFTEQVLWRLS